VEGQLRTRCASVEIVREVGAVSLSKPTPAPYWRDRTELFGTIHHFERALASPPAEPGWWAQIGNRLDALYRAFARHVDATEGGLYDELRDQAPRLDHAVRGLVHEHGVLARRMDTIRARVGQAGADELRLWAAELLAALSSHRQRGADLVWEAYATDIGGET
jgi:hypothetical protein